MQSSNQSLFGGSKKEAQTIKEPNERVSLFGFSTTKPGSLFGSDKDTQSLFGGAASPSASQQSLFGNPQSTTAVSAFSKPSLQTQIKPIQSSSSFQSQSLHKPQSDFEVRIIKLENVDFIKEQGEYCGKVYQKAWLEYSQADDKITVELAESVVQSVLKQLEFSRSRGFDRKVWNDAINSLDPYEVTTPQYILKSQIVKLTKFYISYSFNNQVPSQQGNNPYSRQPDQFLTSINYNYNPVTEQEEPGYDETINIQSLRGKGKYSQCSHEMLRVLDMFAMKNQQVQNYERKAYQDFNQYSQQYQLLAGTGQPQRNLGFLFYLGPKQIVFSYFSIREYAKCFSLCKSIRKTLKSSVIARKNKYLELQVIKLSRSCFVHKGYMEAISKKAQFLSLLCEKLELKIDAYDCKVQNHNQLRTLTEILYMLPERLYEAKVGFSLDLTQGAPFDLNSFMVDLQPLLNRGFLFSSVKLKQIKHYQRHNRVDGYDCGWGLFELIFNSKEVKIEDLDIVSDVPSRYRIQPKNVLENIEIRNCSFRLDYNSSQHKFISKRAYISSMLGDFAISFEHLEELTLSSMNLQGFASRVIGSAPFGSPNCKLTKLRRLVIHDAGQRESSIGEDLSKILQLKCLETIEIWSSGYSNSLANWFQVWQKSIVAKVANFSIKARQIDIDVVPTVKNKEITGFELREGSFSVDVCANEQNYIETFDSKNQIFVFVNKTHNRKLTLSKV